MNLSSNCKVVLAKAGQTAGTSAVESDIIDTLGFRAVAFLGSIATDAANNSVKIEQSDASDMSNAGDLAGSEVNVSASGNSFLIDVVRLSKQGKRDAAHDLFDAHLPLIRYEQQPGVGLAVRKYVLHRRGVLGSPAQRKPGSTLSAKARDEVDYLLSRVARVDKRAPMS